MNKKHLVKQVDWRKVQKLFSGWGEEWFDKCDEEITIAKMISKKKVLYWMKKEEHLRNEVKVQYMKLIHIYGGNSEVFKEV